MYSIFSNIPRFGYKGSWKFKIPLKHLGFHNMGVSWECDVLCKKVGIRIPAARESDIFS